MEPYEANFRSARFRCCLVGYFEGMIIKSYGSLEGDIATEFKGSQGFGYDPIFITKNGSHLAELSKKEKNGFGKQEKRFFGGYLRRARTHAATATRNGFCANGRIHGVLPQWFACERT